VRAAQSRRRHHHHFAGGWEMAPACQWHVSSKPGVSTPGTAMGKDF
jgi:hypothetical protein